MLVLVVALLGAVSASPDIVLRVNRAATTWQAGNGMRTRSLGSRKQPAVTLPIKPRSLIPSSVLPLEFDARKGWPNCPTIGTVLDQGACGSCWAMASTSVLSDRLCVASEGRIQGYVSAHHLLHCCGSMCGGAGCDSGGDDYRAWVYFRTRGVVTGGPYNSSQGCMPYEYEPCQHYYIEGPRPDCYALPPQGADPACPAACTNPAYTTPMSQDIYKVKKSYKVMRNQFEIMKEIMARGPVQAGITVFEDFTHYKTGVYKYTTGKKVGEHSVRLIGWGEQKGVPYWLGVNTWNTDWGEQGFFKIIRGQNDCGIEEAVHAGVPDV